MNETMNRAQISNQENEAFDKSLSPIQNLFWNIPQLFSFEFCDIFQSHFFYKTATAWRCQTSFLNFLFSFQNFILVSFQYFWFRSKVLFRFSSKIFGFLLKLLFWFPSKIFMLVPFQIFGFFRNFFFWIRS